MTTFSRGITAVRRKKIKTLIMFLIMSVIFSGIAGGLSVNKAMNSMKKKVDVSVENIPKDMMGLDIGPKSVEIFRKEILKSRTVLWNGPIGVFEMSNFESGTKAVAEAVVDCPRTTMIGGGDSAAAVSKFNLADKIIG